MAKNFASEILDEFRGRLRNPFYKTFLISYLLYNWEVFFIAFGDESTQSKIIQIKSLISIKYSFLIPLGISCLFFFAYRWVEYFAEWYVTLVQAKKKKKKLQLMGEKTPFSGKEYYTKVNELETINNKNNSLKKEKQELVEHIDLLKNQIISFESREVLNNSSLQLLTKRFEKESFYNSAEAIIGNWKLTKFSHHTEKTSILITITKVDNQQIIINENFPKEGGRQIFNSEIIHQYEDEFTLFLNDMSQSPPLIAILRLKIKKQSDTGKIEFLTGSLRWKTGDKKEIKVEFLRNE